MNNMTDQELEILTDKIAEKLLVKIMTLEQWKNGLTHVVSRAISNVEEYNQAIQLVINTNQASTSFLQRRMHIGYNKAASYIDQMEEEGIIGPNVNGKREIYGMVGDSEYQQAVELVVNNNQASVTYLQRKLRIGYGKAAGYIDRMEGEGIIGPYVEGGEREIYGMAGK